MPRFDLGEVAFDRLEGSTAGRWTPWVVICLYNMYSCRVPHFKRDRNRIRTALAKPRTEVIFTDSDIFLEEGNLLLIHQDAQLRRHDGDWADAF